MIVFRWTINGSDTDPRTLQSKSLLSTTIPTQLSRLIDEDRLQVTIELTPETFPGDASQTIWRYNLSAWCALADLRDDAVENLARKQAQEVGDLLYQPSYWNFENTNVVIHRLSLTDGRQSIGSLWRQSYPAERVPPFADSPKAQRASQEQSSPSFIQPASERQYQSHLPSQKHPLLAPSAEKRLSQKCTPSREKYLNNRYQRAFSRLMGLDAPEEIVQDAGSLERTQDIETSSHGRSAVSPNNTNRREPSGKRLGKRPVPPGKATHNSKRRKNDSVDEEDSLVRAKAYCLFNIVKEGTRRAHEQGLSEWKDDFQLPKPSYCPDPDELALRYDSFAYHKCMRGYQSAFLCACALLIAPNSGRHRRPQCERMDKTKALRLRSWGSGILIVLNELAVEANDKALNIIAALGASEKGYTETWAKKTLQAKVPLDRVMKELARRLLEYKPERKEYDWRLVPATFRVHPIVESTRRSFGEIRNHLGLTAAFFNRDIQAVSPSSSSDEGYGSLPCLTLDVSTIQDKESPAVSRTCPLSPQLETTSDMTRMADSSESGLSSFSVGAEIDLRSSPHVGFAPWADRDVLLGCRIDSFLGFPQLLSSL